MSTVVLFKLLTIFVVVAIGWIVGRLKWLGGGDPARTLANAAYYIFVPALLFRTTARIDFNTIPWGTLVAIFAPMLAMQLVVYAWQRRGLKRGTLPPAGPSVRAISAVFGNSVQVGIPMAA
ncbi:MAG: AEC family transporter, partial [Burkholderiales bacterium]